MTTQPCTPRLDALGLTAAELESLAQQGSVVAESRGDRSYYKLRFRHEGRHRGRYLGSSTALATEVIAELAELQGPRNFRHQHEALDRQARQLLRESKRCLAGPLAQAGFHFHGLAVRRTRAASSARLSSPTSPIDRCNPQQQPGPTVHRAQPTGRSFSDRSGARPCISTSPASPSPASSPSRGPVMSSSTSPLSAAAPTPEKERPLAAKLRKEYERKAPCHVQPTPGDRQIASLHSTGTNDPQRVLTTISWQNSVLMEMAGCLGAHLNRWIGHAEGRCSDMMSLLGYFGTLARCHGQIGRYAMVELRAMKDIDRKGERAEPAAVVPAPALPAEVTPAAAAPALVTPSTHELPNEKAKISTFVPHVSPLAEPAPEPAQRAPVRSELREQDSPGGPDAETPVVETPDATAPETSAASDGQQPPELETAPQLATPAPAPSSTPISSGAQPRTVISSTVATDRRPTSAPSRKTSSSKRSRPREQSLKQRVLACYNGHPDGKAFDEFAAVLDSGDIFAIRDFITRPASPTG